MTCSAPFNFSRAFCVTIKMSRHVQCTRKRRKSAPWPRTLRVVISNTSDSPLQGAPVEGFKSEKAEGRTGSCTTLLSMLLLADCAEERAIGG